MFRNTTSRTAITYARPTRYHPITVELHTLQTISRQLAQLQRKCLKKFIQANGLMVHLENSGQTPEDEPEVAFPIELLQAGLFLFGPSIPVISAARMAARAKREEKRKQIVQERFDRVDRDMVVWDGRNRAIKALNKEIAKLPDVSRLVTLTECQALSIDYLTRKAIRKCSMHRRTQSNHRQETITCRQIRRILRPLEERFISLHNSTASNNGSSAASPS